MVHNAAIISRVMYCGITDDVTDYEITELK